MTEPSLDFKIVKKLSKVAWYETPTTYYPSVLNTTP